MPRPDRLVVVAGTGTDVGKTFVGCAVLRALRARGVRVAARKPAQSFAPPPTGTDAHLLGSATGEDPERVTPPHRWYPVPLAPPMAAAALGLAPFTVAELRAEVDAGWDVPVDVGVVETAGGLRSPIADDGDCLALLVGLRPDAVVLVAGAGLGTINDVRLGAGVLERPPVVVLNRYDDSDDTHRRNAAWLRDRDGFTVVTAMDELADRLRPR